MVLQAHETPTFTALEVSTIVADFFASKGQVLKLKWPNDLITREDKKCGGILVQNSQSHFIAGIGVNLFREGEEFGGIFETSFPVEKRVWAQELSHYIRTHRYTSTDALREKWNSYCYHSNRRVRVTEGTEAVVGIFRGLGPFGEALVETESGVQSLYNGSLRLA